MNYQKLYQDILSLDGNIRMVTICDTEGKIVHSDHRPGITNLLTPDESRKSLEMAVNAWKSRSQLASKIGKGKYVLAEYEKIKRITMPLGDSHLVYVTTELPANHVNIISGITSLASSLDNDL
jgi:hypothetical protein